MNPLNILRHDERHNHPAEDEHAEHRQNTVTGNAGRLRDKAEQRWANDGGEFAEHIKEAEILAGGLLRHQFAEERA